MVGQLGQVTLDITERDAPASLLGVAEQVGGDLLGTLNDAHGPIVGRDLRRCLRHHRNMLRHRCSQVSAEVDIGRPVTVVRAHTVPTVSRQSQEICSD